MLPFMQINMLKFLSDKDDLLALKISLPIENKRSTAALEGMAVLNLMNKSTNICQQFLGAGLQPGPDQVLGLALK